MNGCDEKNEASRPDALGSRLLKARTVLITDTIDQEMAERVMGQLMVLDAESHDPIRVMITTPGGSIDAGFAIYDMMRFVASQVITIGAGWVASMGVPILLAVDKEHRFALPNTRFMLHQPAGGVGGQLQDIRIEAQEILKIRERINALVSEETGQDIEKVARDCDRNFWMNAQEALDYGIVGGIIANTSDIT